MSCGRRPPGPPARACRRGKPGPATLRHHDAVIGSLRAAGFSVPMTGHAISLIDSYLYGFVLQELSLPFQDAAEVEEIAGAIVREMPADTYPHLTELATERVLRPGYDYADEFAFGLTLVLDALHPDEPPPA
ncbi:TetR/AcrR family transcriptional regulator C-terminal domain-containing protein [Streptomyces sp. NPDC088106]|uniref:TetR/AcrR family transcriptional regulator C-terminal domain-containing protein n=1 Tax=Streptomyces TaxID=1883 RepID=UPI003437A0DA